MKTLQDNLRKIINLFLEVNYSISEEAKSISLEGYTFPPSFVCFHLANRKLGETKPSLLEALIKSHSLLISAEKNHYIGEMYFLSAHYEMAGYQYKCSLENCKEAINLIFSGSFDYIYEYQSLRELKICLELQLLFFEIEMVEAKSFNFYANGQIKQALASHNKEIAITKIALKISEEFKTDLDDYFHGHFFYVESNRLKCLADLAKNADDKETFTNSSKAANQKSVKLNPQWKEYSENTNNQSHLIETYMNADDYLSQIYSGFLDESTKELLLFLDQTANSLKSGVSFLEFGGGPTIYSLIPYIDKVKYFHFVDYDPQCLRKVLEWKLNCKNAFNWLNYTEFLISQKKPFLEKNQLRIEALQKEDLLRKKLKYITLCNAYDPTDIMLGFSKSPYDVVAQNYCLEGITSSKKDWEVMNKKLMNLVKPGGRFLSVSLIGANYWTIKNKKYDAVYLDEKDIICQCEGNGFTVLRYKEVRLNPRNGYDGFAMLEGLKND